MSGREFHWEELSSAEVRASLAQLEREGRPAVSAFLDIHQWLPLSGKSGVVVDGGYPEAQYRRVALGDQPELVGYYNILPETMPQNARTPRGARRMLGKLAGSLGRVGDLACGSHFAVIAEPGVLDNLEGISTQMTKTWSPPEIPLKRVTAASNRMDAVVAAVFQVSREEAQTALKYGFIYKNFQQVAKRTVGIAPGDLLIFRSKGKARIEDMGQSKSGRNWLEVTAQPS